MKNNQILTNMPAVDDRTYAPHMPEWLKICIRISLAAMTAALAYLTGQNSAVMPLWTKILVFILIPAFAWMFLNGKMWRMLPYFMADTKGMYFISNSSRINGTRRLFVPWQNIRNIRPARADDGENTLSATLDIKASHEHIAEFFNMHGAPKPRFEAIAESEYIPVIFYNNLPPSPKAVVKQLIKINTGS